MHKPIFTILFIFSIFPIIAMENNSINKSGNNEELGQSERNDAEMLYQETRNALHSIQKNDSDSVLVSSREGTDSPETQELLEVYDEVIQESNHAGICTNSSESPENTPDVSKKEVQSGDQTKTRGRREFKEKAKHVVNEFKEGIKGLVEGIKEGVGIHPHHGVGTVAGSQVVAVLNQAQKDTLAEVSSPADHKIEKDESLEQEWQNEQVVIPQLIQQEEPVQQIVVDPVVEDSALEQSDASNNHVDQNVQVVSDLDAAVNQSGEQVEPSSVANVQGQQEQPARHLQPPFAAQISHAIKQAPGYFRLEYLIENGTYNASAKKLNEFKFELLKTLGLYSAVLALISGTIYGAIKLVKKDAPAQEPQKDKKVSKAEMGEFKSA